MRMRYVALCALVFFSMMGLRCGSELRDYEMDTAFTLHNTSGEKFAFAEELHGRVVLLYFGFTHCPDFCPATLSKIRRAYRILGARAGRVSTVMVTVDPERDSPQRLKEYLASFEVDAIGLTGSKDELTAVARRFGATFQQRPLENSELDYTVDHSTYLYLIDPDGRVRHVFKHDDSPQLIAEKVQAVLPLF